MKEAKTMEKIKKEDCTDLLDKIIVGIALRKDIHIDRLDSGYQLTVGDRLTILSEDRNKTVDEKTIYAWENDTETCKYRNHKKNTLQ